MPQTATKATETNPSWVRLSDGSAFYNAPAVGQLPAALDSGALKIKEQAPLTTLAMTQGQPAATTSNLTGTGSVACAVSGYASAQIQLSGTYNAAVGFIEGSIDGGTVYNNIPYAQGSTGSSGLVAPTANSTNLYTVPCGGLTHVRYRASVFSSGTLAISITPSAAATPSGTVISGTVPTSIAGTVTVDSELGAAAALAEGAANPTAPTVGADLQMFNGTTWDRQHNNWHTTTGDTGTKTSTFNGATQTNYDARGAYIMVILGTVSGTTPTLACQLQVLYDAGAGFANFGPAMANLTASNNLGLFVVYPSNISQAAGTTPVTLTSGATQTVPINAPLPRSWRIVYTIGGSSPSFALSSVHVQYQL